MADLPPVGSAELLARLSPYVPDQFIDTLIPRRKGRGRHMDFSSAQLFRTLLLSVLTPVHSFNLLSRLLGEHRSWRRFAFLPHRQRVPGPRMLHEFRQKLPPSVFRALNAHLLGPLLDGLGAGKTVALIDATDLPAATNAYKKTVSGNFLLTVPPWADAVSSPDRVGGSSATKSIRYGYGFPKSKTGSCWYHWFHGRHQRPVATACFWSRAYVTAPGF